GVMQVLRRNDQARMSLEVAIAGEGQPISLDVVRQGHRETPCWAAARPTLALWLVALLIRKPRNTFREALLCRLEFQRNAVDAIALMGRRGAIGKDVTQMAAAGGAMHLGAGHAVAGIGIGLHGARNGVVEARPARAALELDRGLEERRIAAD